MSNETTQTTETNAENGENNRPDYVIKQYRQVRIEDGFKTRKEQIGVAWKGDNGAISLRFSGIQVIESDLYLFPMESDSAE